MRRFVPLPLLLPLLLLAGCALPRWPVDGSVTSPFGLRGARLHHGVDVRVPTGTPVRAMGPGTVRFAGTMRGYGRVIIIDHGQGIESIYAHLSEIQVQEGQAISGHPVIALSGSSGTASAPHLHFEILRGGNAEDPVVLLGSFPRPRR